MKVSLYRLLTRSNEETTQWGNRQGDQTCHHKWRAQRCQIPLEVIFWEGQNITYIVFWPRMHNLNIIIRKHRTKPKWGIFYLGKKPNNNKDCILLKCQCQCHRRQRKAEELFQTERDWEDITTKFNNVIQNWIM